MNKNFFPLFGGIALVVIWEAAAVLFSVPEYLVSRPSRILFELLLSRQELFSNALYTLGEAMLGYFLAIIIGLSVGFIFVKNNGAKKTFFPYFIIFQSIPVITLAPLVLIWVGSDFALKALLAFMLSVFPIIVSTTAGLSSTPENCLEVFKLMNASEKDVWVKLRFPFALPFIFQSLKISLGLSFTGAIAGEFIVPNHGLGSLVFVSSYYLNTTTMFAAIVLVVSMVMALLLALEKIERKALFWHEGIGRKMHEL